MKKYILTILAVLLVVGGLAGIKALQIRGMIAQKSKFAMPPTVVTSTKAQHEEWGESITAVGSLTAVQGVEVAAALEGQVVRIDFTAGAKVQAGDLLAAQDITTESAQLREAKSAAVLAKTNLDRHRKLVASGSVSKAEFDNAEASYQEATARADNIQSVIAKKTIRAPFAGRLGIRQINLGQILKVGQPIVSLQAMDPLFVDFSLPQQQLARIRSGLTVEVSGDTLGSQVVTGSITTINPGIDQATRTVKVQATVANPDENLHPGMFVDVAIILPERQPMLVIPATAVLYAPYSDSVFIIEDNKDGKPGKVIRQQFVRLGEKRGDFMAVLSGLQPDDEIASTGVFKLRNGQAVVIDNSITPEFHLTPKPENE